MATVSFVMPFKLQYLDFNQVDSSLAPLLALQEKQNLAIFSAVTILASLMTCSQVAELFLDWNSLLKDTPQ
jgi:hypothetical protein